jgi:hypothetical protein
MVKAVAGLSMWRLGRFDVEIRAVEKISVRPE